MILNLSQHSHGSRSRNQHGKKPVLNKKEIAPY